MPDETCLKNSTFNHDWRLEDDSKPDMVKHEDLESKKLSCNDCGINAWNIRYSGEDEFGKIPQPWIGARLAYDGSEAEYQGIPLLAVRAIKREKKALGE